MRRLVFVSDSWIDYEHLPKTGMEVAFDLQASVPRNIRAYVDGADKGSDEEEGKQDTKSQTNESKKESEQSEEKEDASKKKGAARRVPLSKIKEETPLLDCVNGYFEEYLDLLQKNRDALGSAKSLDFFKMKRFLVTAYYNLRQIDRGISNDKFKAIERELKRLTGIYESFVKLSKLPKEVAFEIIYLKNQPDYIKANSLADTYRSEMNSSIMLEKNLRNELKLKEVEFAVEKDAAKKKELEAKLKPIRKNYADIVHSASSSRENLIYIGNIINDYKTQRFEAFCSLFEQNITYIKNKLMKVLNVKAYEFDYTLWVNAKDSVYIRKFFGDCKIEGTYCSKTFLKYYIKNLDKEKLGDENRKLYDLLNYLESSYTKRVVILCKDIDSAEVIKVAVEKIDKEYSVVSSSSPMEILNAQSQHQPDLVILEINLRLMNAFEFVSRYKKLYPNTMTDFCLIYEEDEAKMVAEHENKEIRYSMRKPITQKELLDKLKVIL